MGGIESLPGNNPPQPYGWEEGIEIGNDPIWDSPQGKNEPKKESPEGGKGDRDHQPPQAGGDATAEDGGVMVQRSSNCGHNKNIKKLDPEIP